MLDVTLNDRRSRDALLGVFYRQCRELPPRGNKKVVYRTSIVSVYRDEDYDDLYDVILTRGGVNCGEDDYCGVHEENLEKLVDSLLFQGNGGGTMSNE